MSIKLKNLHVLIIENLQPMRDLTSAVLKAQGVGNISYASDGERGFEAYCRHRPDIILADWHMAGLNGLDLTKRIRTSPGSPDRTVPIVMMTGYGSPEKISKARDLGVTEFLVKPFSAADLAKRVMNIIKAPRDFIITPTFVGPDRRRKKDAGQSPKGGNSRVNPEGYTQIIKANNILQAKVGFGVIPDGDIAKSQSLIEKNTYNFAPIAMQFLKQYYDGLKIAQSEENPNRRSIERMIDPVMQIKANARIFKFGLLGDLSSIMLNFLEGMNELDGDAIEIIEAHHQTLHRIVQDEMRGDGGDVGRVFESELDAACKRYINSRIIRQREAMQIIMAENHARGV